ncbi:ead/Ea22-like family protein [Klebsiella pneumoniae]|uniref:ead/Ea22-like family protein n=1 Tax=Klebsiella pneumoniae TaxID=573 RepID=UPI0035B70F7E
MTDITELGQRMKAAAKKASNGDWVKESGNGWEACCSANDQANVGFIIAHFVGPDAAENREFVQAANPANVLALVEALEKAQQRIDELENDEIQEEGNQFLVVRHPGKVPVIKHPVGELEYYLRQIFKADPLATIDIVTHRYYGVGGQFVKDADEYLHEMSVKVEAE